MKSMHGDSEGQYLQGSNVCFQYSYVKRVSGSYNKSVIERQPERCIYLRDPKTYKGEISNVEHSATCHWKIQDDVNIINGVVEKADGTFLEGFFFNQLYEGGAFQDIVLGPYPLYEVDVDRLVSKGKINAVLNLQTDTEMRQRGLDENQLKMWYQTKGIKDYIRFSVVDNNNKAYADRLFEASKALDHLIQKKRTVYVHCTSGQSRCTTLSAFYLCLFLKAKNWQNPEEVLKAIKLCHNGSSPNTQVVTLGLQKYKQFQIDLLERMRRVKEEEERRRKLEEEEKRRLAEIAREEELRLQRQREEYLAAERERNRRLEDDRRRLEKQEEERRRQRRMREEQERQRLIAIGNDRDAHLNMTLRQLEAEEIDEINKIKQAWLLK